MKKIFTVLLSVFMLVVVFPITNVRAAGNYIGTVEMSGQYKTGSGADPKTYDYTLVTTKQFSNPTDKLGFGNEHEGSLNHLRTNFLGWTDQPLVNGEIAPGAKVFTADDTVETAFPNGLNGGEKLYAVYYLLTIPNDLWSGLSFIMDPFKEIKVELNKGVTTINANVSDENSLPDTSLAISKNENNVRTIIDYYAKKDDISTVNEVILNAEYEMSSKIALLSESNPYGQHYGFRIFTKNYDGDMAVADAKDSKKGYTHVDLNVKIDEGISVPDSFYLNFKSHTWRPLYVLDGAKNVLEIKDPKTGASLGNDKNTFNTISSNTTKNNYFEVVNSAGNREFTIRVILRTDNYKITTKVDGAESVGASIIENMELNLISKSEINNLFGLSLTEEELNKKIFTISDAKAKELADSNAVTTFGIKGNVDIYSNVYAGTVSGIDLATVIKNTEGQFSNTIKYGYKYVDETMFIKIDKTGQVYDENGQPVELADKKAIFNIGNRFENGFKDLVYTVYSDSNKTQPLQKETDVTWTIEPVYGFEDVLISSDYAGTLNTLTTTYKVNQTNTNKSVAIKSGIYKVTATLINGEHDWAYIVVPGDVDRDSTVSSNDASETTSYASLRNINKYSIIDEFTLILSDVDYDETVSTNDASLMIEMRIGKKVSN